MSRVRQKLVKLGRRNPHKAGLRQMFLKDCSKAASASRVATPEDRRKRLQQRVMVHHAKLHRESTVQVKQLCDRISKAHAFVKRKEVLDSRLQLQAELRHAVQKASEEKDLRKPLALSNAQ